jgi:hypothetical protein
MAGCIILAIREISGSYDRALFSKHKFLEAPVVYFEGVVRAGSPLLRCEIGLVPAIMESVKLWGAKL